MSSLTRNYEICQLLNNGSTADKQFLSVYQENCVGYVRKPNVNDYFQHVTMCPAGKKLSEN